MKKDKKKEKEKPNQKNKKNQFLWIGVGLFVFIISCLSVLFVLTLTIISNNKLEKTGEITEGKDSIQEESDIFVMTCLKKETKPYSGYAVGDTITCTLKYNEDNESFKEKDEILEKITYSILPSDAVRLTNVYASSNKKDSLSEYLKFIKQGNEITIENTKSYGPPEGKTCDMKLESCKQQYIARDGFSVGDGPLIYSDSIHAIDLHMEFNVQSNLPSNKMVEVNLEGIQFVIKDVENDSEKIYKTSAKYSFDTENNDKYYCSDRTVYKLGENMNYSLYYNISCKSSSCACGSKDALSAGYLDVIENNGSQNDSYRVVYNMNTKEVWREFKNLFLVRIEDKVYVVGSSKDSVQNYSILLLNEEKTLKEFNTEGNKKVLFATKEKEFIDIGVNDGTHLKYDPKKGDFVE